MNTTNFSSVRAKEQKIKSPSIKILIVDDQKVIRARLQEILSSPADLEIVGIADDGDKAIAMIESLKPDVVLMDIEMPKINGIELTKIISRRFPEPKILILSTHEQEQYIQKSISAGATGYINKNTSATGLIIAIHAVKRGYSHFELNLLKKVRPTSSNLDLKQKVPSEQMKRQDICRIAQRPNLSKLQDKSNKSLILKQNNGDIASTLPTVKAEEFLPSIGKWLTWGSLAMVTAIVLAIPATALLKYKTTVKAQATVRPAGEVRLVQAATEGKIVEILVEEGQAVKKGDIIARVDPSRWQTKKTHLEKAIAQQRLQLAQLNLQIGIVESQITAETEGNNSEILAAWAELAGNIRNHDEKNVEVDTQVREAEAQVEATQATLNAAKSKQMRYKSVADKGALSKEQLAEAQLEVEQQQQEMASAKAQLERAVAALDPSDSEVKMAAQRIHQARKSGIASVASLNREQKALQQQRIEIDKQLEQDAEELHQVELDLSNTDITATAVGTISELKLRNPGQTVQLGQEIAQVIPSNAALEVKATVSPQEIGKLEAGQKVQMRISACPYPDYGTLDGKVSQVAKDTSKPQDNISSNNSQPEKSALAFYEVSVSPTRTSFGKGKNICSLQFGMEGTADIITKEETVMRFLLRKAKLISGT